MSTIAITGYAILAIYCLALSYITAFCLMQFHLLWKYHRAHIRHQMKPRHHKALRKYPFVTIQLPIYNEQYVVERLIDNITAFHYPRDRFEIQVLDDSTDETLEISRRKVEEYQRLGFQIQLITRPGRAGFKAGALKYGMQSAKGTYIAIFDADFLPRPDFLLQTIPYFEDPRVGVVQTRWEHINQNYSLITRLQAFQLNVHFTIEQTGRKAGNYLLQFNGTAGIWRRKAIEDAGGWEADTLTEDLDLSYRAQLRGWKIAYLEEIGAPAELPAEMNGLKSQQFRWMKGGAETAKKMLPSVWKSGMPIAKKIHASLHLLSSTIFVFVFIVGVFSVPLLFLIEPLGINLDYFAVFLTGFLTLSVVYFVGNVQASWTTGTLRHRILKFLVLFPVFLALSMGLSLHNSIAVMQGYLGKKSAFIRTPKFAIRNLSDQFRKRRYLSRKIPLTTFIEGVLAMYFFGAILAGFYFQDTSFVLFHFLLMTGYGLICYYSIRHVRLK